MPRLNARFRSSELAKETGDNMATNIKLHGLRISYYTGKMEGYLRYREIPHALVDFGFFASMFRHFSQDPRASDIMRLRAPGVFAWQARLWNARASTTHSDLVSALPADLDPILQDVGDGYLPYLNANAEAWQPGVERFDPVIQSVQYRAVPGPQGALPQSADVNRPRFSVG